MLLLLVLPLVFFSVAEVILQLSGYGIAPRLFIESGIPETLVINDDFFRLFYPSISQTAVESGEVYRPSLLTMPKPNDVYRVFILGGSTAKGFPYYDRHAFPNIAAEQLNANLRGKRIEVHNLAQSAMSSYYVRETARLARKYEPDLIIIYSGHNEYYGTIAAGSGGGHFGKKLFIALNRFRVFQFLFTLMDGTDRTAPVSESLMAQRLRQGSYPADVNFDERIARRFIDNIDDSARYARQAGIDVLVMEPISNLLDMPPFSSTAPDHILNEIRDTASQAPAKGRWPDIAADLFSDVIDSEDNAHFLYLREYGSTDPSIENLVMAKDRDTSPFRARSVLIDSLRDWANRNPDVGYIATDQEILRLDAIENRGNSLFIDHLHFTFTGQLIVGNIVARRIAEQFLVVEDMSILTESEVRERIFFHPALQYEKEKSVLELITQPPFINMAFPYVNNHLRETLVKNPLNDIPQIGEQLARSRSMDILQLVGEYYLENRQFEQLYDFLQTLVYINPGDPRTHLNLADLVSINPQTHQAALYHFQIGYLLSGRDPEVLSRFKNFTEQNGYQSQLEAFLQRLGE